MSRWHYLTVVALLSGACFFVFYGNHALRTYPQPRFEIVRANGRLVITQVDQKLPLKAGDILLAIDGVSLCHGEPSASAEALTRGNHRHLVTFQRGGITRQASVWMESYLPVYLPWIALATSLFILVIAAYTFVRKPDSPAIINFVVLHCSLAILIATIRPGTFFIQLFFWFFFFLAPPLMFRLMANLPEDETLQQRLRIPVQALMAYGLLAGLLGMISVSIQHHHVELLVRYQTLFTAAHRSLLVLQGIFILLLLVLAFAFPLRWVRTIRARRKLQWLLWGLAAGVSPFYFFLYLPFTMLGLNHCEFQKAVMMAVIPFFLLIPVSSAVAIIRYRFLDIEFIIRHSIIYVITLLLTAAFATVIATGLWLFILPREHGVTPLLLVLALCLLTLCRPLYRRVRRLVEKEFRRFDYDLVDTLEKLAAQLCDTVSRDQIINIISRLMVRLLSPDRLVIIFQDQDGRSFVAHSVNVGEGAIRKFAETPFDELFGMAGQSDSATLPLLKQLVDFPVAIPINAAGCPGGMVLLGPRAQREPYREKDLHFLNILADHAGLALRAISGDDFMERALLTDPSPDNAAVLHRLAHLKQEKESLERLAMTDPLTGCFNRRYFFSALQREIHRAVRFGEAFGLLMLDLDHFKRINDESGHAVGDEVLKGFVRIVSETVRNTDIFCRFGGEEFVLILPRVNPETLYLVAEKVRKAVQKHELPINGRTFSVSVSIGAVIFDGRLGVMPVEQLINQADRAMYFAKNSGRNQCVLYDDLPAEWKLGPPAGTSGAILPLDGDRVTDQDGSP